MDKHAEFDRYGCKRYEKLWPSRSSVNVTEVIENVRGINWVPIWQPIVIYSNHGLFHTVVEIYGDLGRKHKFFIPPVWYPLYTSVQGLTVGTVRLIRLKQEWYPYPVVKKILLLLATCIRLDTIRQPDRGTDRHRDWQKSISRVKLLGCVGYWRTRKWVELMSGPIYFGYYTK